ncbi:Protein of unknown function [Halobiforma haloterrestris]|uniref:DUF1102 domain-containing protein n=1 Tax=Natronobacterium haloterrestre TaxID=148448 RepID=A0A1I1E1I0_NATHA|nr:DUF1102 domain-containing protein [Halobiforma haloterrestris]SFB79068.1 Protein of unknown function [Halobiforma haloterrestris]
MKRRHILGLATGTLSGSLLVGSGAFNTARVDRNISVDVVTDERAYLALNALPTENESGDVLGRSTNPGRKTRFQFPGTYEELDDLTRGEGLGSNSRYYFDRLVEVRNQGTNNIVVYTEYEGMLDFVAFYDTDDDRRLLTDKSTGIELAPGEDFDAGVVIDTSGTESGTTVDETVTIVGRAIDGD